MNPAPFSSEQLAAYVNEQVSQQVAAALQSQQHQRQQSQQASMSSSPQQPRVERPRMPAPASYEGKASTLDEWIVELEQQFEWYQTHTELERLRFATAFMKGTARDWWLNLAVPARAAIVTWDQMKDALRGRFQPVTTAEMARARLATLGQGKATVHQYVAAYRKLLISLTTMSEDDRLFAFVRGLQPSIAMQLRVHGVKSVEQAIEMAVRVGSLSEFAALASASAHTTSSSSTSSLPAAASSSAPMELDALSGIEGLEQDTNGTASSSSSSTIASADGPITRGEFQQLLNAMREQRTGGRRQGAPSNSASQSSIKQDGRVHYGDLTRERMDKHFAEGTCFSCGKTGHQARNCRSRQGK